MRYRKLPVEVDAVRYTGNTEEVQEFVGDRPKLCMDNTVLLRINGKHGKINKGDWIIRRDDGSLYFCRHNKFIENYEEVPQNG